MGTILAELMEHTPLFTGASDLDQLAKIAKFIGGPKETPKEAQWFTIKTEPEDLVNWTTFFADRVAENKVLGEAAVDLVGKLVT